MKIRQALFIFISLFLFVDAQEVCSNPEKLVTFSDPNLETIISENLGLSTITCQDIVNLVELQAERSEINSLEGLQYAVNLTDLRLRFNQISDLTALENLTQLKRLWLNNNNLDDEDLSTLADLIQLEDLRLGNNNISYSSSLIQLISMPNLGILHLHNNNLSSLNILSSIRSLRDVNVGGNPLSQEDLEILRQLPNLQAISISSLQLDDMRIAVSLFPNPSTARLLVLNNNQISDLDPLQSLPNLRHLHLAGNPIEDFGVIGNLESLTNLTLSNTNFTDFEVLMNLSNLRWLALRSNALQDISELLEVSGLQDGSNLFLQNNCIAEDAPAIQKLKEQGVNVRVSVASSCTN